MILKTIQEFHVSTADAAKAKPRQTMDLTRRSMYNVWALVVTGTHPPLKLMTLLLLLTPNQVCRGRLLVRHLLVRHLLVRQLVVRLVKTTLKK